MRLAYKTVGVPHTERLQELKFKDVCTSKEQDSKAFPCLKCKAAVARHLIPVLLLICKERPIRDEEEQLRLTCLENLDMFFEIIESYNHHIPGPEAEKAFEVTVTCLLAYSRLSRIAIENSRFLWNITPKFHYWFHLAYLCRFHNPRMGWVFKDRFRESISPQGGAADLVRKLGRSRAGHFLERGWDEGVAIQNQILGLRSLRFLYSRGRRFRRAHCLYWSVLCIWRWGLQDR